MRALRHCEKKAGLGDAGSTANPGTWRVSTVISRSDAGPGENVSAGETILSPGSSVVRPFATKILRSGRDWWAVEDSNLRPSVCKTDALAG